MYPSCPIGQNCITLLNNWASQVALEVKNPPANAGEIREMQVQSLGREEPLEEGVAIHPSTFPREIPWTEKPGGLHSIVSPRVGCD